MLVVGAKTSASDTTKYFFGYYAETQIGDPPIWKGEAAEKLGIKGIVTEKDFEAILNNKHPITGDQITERHDEKRRVAYELNFSAPKSVSLVYGLTEDKDILDSFEWAREQTMKHIEKSAEVRVRVGGKTENRLTGNLIYTSFIHGETRPVDYVNGNGEVTTLPEPHLHDHVIVANVTYDQAEKKWKAVEFGSAYINRQYNQALFDSYLAHSLKEKDYPIAKTKNSFEISGFEKSTLDKVSSRTKQIDAKVLELGGVSPEVKARLGAMTRNKKAEYDQASVKKELEKRFTKAELDHVYGVKNSNAEGQKPISPKQALEYALSHELTTKSVVSEKELLTTGLKRSFAHVSPEKLKAELGNYKGLLSRTDNSGEIFYTTQEALAEEKKLVKSALDGQGKFQPISMDYKIRNKQLTGEQKNAVRHVLASKDFITAISGRAGVGKTYSLREIANGVKESGLGFQAVARSSDASRNVLRADGFEGATTIADLLQNKSLQDKISNGVLFVDEASLVGNSDMNRLITIARKQNSRILLVGDTAQHNSSPERGDSFRILQKYGGVKPARIDKIQRQQTDEYRKAVTLLSEGDTEKGFNQLDKMGAIKESESIESLYENAADDFVKSVKIGDKVMVVSTTHAQGKKFTETVREQLKKVKLLKGKERKFNIQKNLNYTNAEKTDISNYEKGQIIQFNQHVKGGIKRGAKYQVSGINDKGNVQILPFGSKDNTKPIDLPINHTERYSVYEQEKINMAKGDIIRITQNGFSTNKKRMDNGNIFKVKGFDRNGNILATTGKRDLVIDKDYGNLNLGYYRTSHSSQGATVNKVIVLQSSMSGKAASKEQLYVSASRGKFSISIHTDNKELMLKNVQRTSERIAAMELTEVSISKESKTAKIKKSIQTGIEKLKKMQDLNKIKLTHINKPYGRSAPTK